MDVSSLRASYENLSVSVLYIYTTVVFITVKGTTVVVSIADMCVVNALAIEHSNSSSEQ